jgi:two-component system chemotaxis response regulator CheB
MSRGSSHDLKSGPRTVDPLGEEMSSVIPSGRGDVSTTIEQADSPPETLVVVVVADSRARAGQLSRMLELPGFAVAAEAVTADQAEAAVVAHEPAAVLVDLHPAAGGIEAIERIMGTRPTPIVVCGAMAEHARTALAAGAVDVVGALDALPTSPQYVTALRRHVRVASRVRVITHPRNRLRARGLGVPAPAPGEPDCRRAPDGPESAVRVVVIGASTGGPPALATILADLPRRLPVPVLVVQHMADGFVEGLASWLDGLASVPVVMAEHGTVLRPGTVYVAPARMNTVLRPGLRVELCPADPGQFHVPAVDAAFASAVDICGERALGVLLTGMGRDGAAGLLAMRQAGCLTIGQDEPTSVVWGMPAAAQALGAVAVELPLPRIAAAVVAEACRPLGRVVRP